MRKPQIRRDKRSPCEDFWHTIKWGLLVAALLFLILPCLMG